MKYFIRRISLDTANLEICNKIYIIKSSGEILNSKNKVLSGRDNGNGYKTICISNGRKRIKNFYIHRLVAEAFIPNPHNYKTVNHKDLDRSNNASYNLEWCSLKDNVNYSVILGSYANLKAIKPVIQLSLTGDLIKRWANASEAASVIGSTKELIQQACSQTNLRCITAKGFIWVYEKDYSKGNLDKFNKTLIKYRKKINFVITKFNVS